MSMVEINQFNIKTGILQKYSSVVFSNSYWHKIIVENVEGYLRDMVLGTIMKFCYPLHFIPVRYKSVRNSATFLMKNCGPAIEKICESNLIIPNPLKKDRPFKISLQLCFADANDLKINIHHNVANVLKKRLNKETGALNLSNFGNDADLEEYCPLSQPKLLFYVLHLAKDMEFKTLVLASNDIESLKPIEALVGVESLTAIDLRHNNIKSILEISSLKDLNLTQLWLDGNPLCDNFDLYSYSKLVREQLPTVERLDNNTISKGGFLPFRFYSSCSKPGFNLVDQFLEHYFTLYDTNNRSILRDVYHKDALFSISSMYLSGQSTSLGAKLNVYKKISRNILQITNLSKSAEFLYCGPNEILKILTSLPVTEHDPFGFTIDLIMHTEKSTIFVVGGVFREISDSITEPDRLLSFNRTFVLLAGKNGEYTITNDIMHITNAPTQQATLAFKQVKVPESPFIYIPRPRDDKEMDEMAQALKAITGLNIEWSQKCLEECKYDLKKALTLFVDLFKIDKIPDSAFDSSSKSGVTDIKALLNESHQYGKIEQINQPTALITNAQAKPPIEVLRNIQVKPPQPIKPPQSVNPAVHVNAPTPVPPPLPQALQNSLLQSMAMQQIRHPLMGNVQIMPSPLITPLRQMISLTGPLANTQPAINQVFQNSNNSNKKTNTRPGLVNILLKK